jgi:hypothetical protein
MTAIFFSISPPVVPAHHLHHDAEDESGDETGRGRERVFALDLKRLDKARQYLDQVAAEWDAAAARLKAFVEEEG